MNPYGPDWVAMYFPPVCNCLLGAIFGAPMMYVNTVRENPQSQRKSKSPRRKSASTTFLRTIYCPCFLIIPS